MDTFADGKEEKGSVSIIDVVASILLNLDTNIGPSGLLELPTELKLVPFRMKASISIPMNTDASLNIKSYCRYLDASRL